MIGKVVILSLFCFLLLPSLVCAERYLIYGDIVKVSNDYYMVTGIVGKYPYIEGLPVIYCNGLVYVKYDKTSYLRYRARPLPLHCSTCGYGALTLHHNYEVRHGS